MQKTKLYKIFCHFSLYYMFLDNIRIYCDNGVDIYNFKFRTKQLVGYNDVYLKK